MLQANVCYLSSTNPMQTPVLQFVYASSYFSFDCAHLIDIDLPSMLAVTLFLALSVLYSGYGLYQDNFLLFIHN